MGLRKALPDKAPQKIQYFTTSRPYNKESIALQVFVEQEGLILMRSTNIWRAVLTRSCDVKEADTKLCSKVPMGQGDHMESHNTSFSYIHVE